MRSSVHSGEIIEKPGRFWQILNSVSFSLPWILIISQTFSPQLIAGRFLGWGSEVLSLLFPEVVLTPSPDLDLSSLTSTKGFWKKEDIKRRTRDFFKLDCGYIYFLCKILQKITPFGKPASSGLFSNSFNVIMFHSWKKLECFLLWGQEAAQIVGHSRTQRAHREEDHLRFWGPCTERVGRSDS